jgi:hypothetical protein
MRQPVAARSAYCEKSRSKWPPPLISIPFAGVLRIVLAAAIASNAAATFAGGAIVQMRVGGGPRGGALENALPRMV